MLLGLYVQVFIIGSEKLLGQVEINVQVLVLLKGVLLVIGVLEFRCLAMNLTAIMTILMSGNLLVIIAIRSHFACLLFV